MAAHVQSLRIFHFLRLSKAVTPVVATCHKINERSFYTCSFLAPSKNLKNCRAGFAKKVAKAGKGGASGPAMPDEPLEVNKNPHDLIKYCVGSNYLKEGQDVELKPDEEYPDWLWELYLGPPKKVEELDPNTPKYWRKLRQQQIRRNNRLAKLKKF